MNLRYTLAVATALSALTCLSAATQAADAGITYDTSGSSTIYRSERSYFKLDVGPNLVSDFEVSSTGETVSLEPGVRVDLAGGYRLSDGVALEAEFGLARNRLDRFGYLKPSDYSYSQVPILLNAIWTIPNQSEFRPYIGVGAGTVIAIQEYRDETITDAGFAAQAQLGIDVMVSASTSIGVGYKLLATRVDDVESTFVLNHAFMIGLNIGL